MVQRIEETLNVRVQYPVHAAAGEYPHSAHPALDEYVVMPGTDGAPMERNDARLTTNA